MNQTCVTLGPMIVTLQCPRNNQNEECSGNGVCKVIKYLLYGLLSLIINWHNEARNTKGFA